jgi:Pyruvate phosphate dikinase, AMP/ATP-binding domain
LIQEQCEHCDGVRDHLALQISEYLGQVDKTVKGVYQYQPTSASQIVEGEAATSPTGHIGINLIVWVERKSAAFLALIESLEAVLRVSRQQIPCVKATDECFSLDVKLVDDQDVENRLGYALFVHNTYIQSRPVWLRSGIPETRSFRVSPTLPAIESELPASFDPELIPESRLIDHAFSIENIPPEDRVAMEPHLTELKVILIRRMISDQLNYIRVARRWFTVADLSNIYQHRIGYGRIGGKSAGMLLAARILNEVAEDGIKDRIKTPESYFVGSELIYIFMSMNGLMYWTDQKYKPEDQIWGEYPMIQEDFQAGSFPPEILDTFRELLAKTGKQPLIVRSSSQLEDNFGTSFAGKYDSFFCPNQGTPEENLNALTNAIARTYASTLKPEALLYRRSKGLQDYDERMAVLIQVVEGEEMGNYYLPAASGVAFSRNIYRWSPQIRPEDGFTRLVWGLGTRAVQRLGDDYPRLVALSHPTLQPDASTEAIRRYSQRYVDLIDLKGNAFKTLPIHQVLTPGYVYINLIAQIERDGFFLTPKMRLQPDEIPSLTINFYDLLNRTDFAPLLSHILRTLEEHYHSALDLEFALQLLDPRSANPRAQITLLQCRPQSYLKDILPPKIPEDLPEEDIVFSTRFMVPRGYLTGIRYVLFIRPDAYFNLRTAADRNHISQTIGQLNSLLEDKSFICIGPGRWGSTNTDLGVYVSYADIHNTGALVELSGREIGTGPEPSLGTHFFQDLMEAQIYPLAVPLDDQYTRFNWDFLDRAPNALQDLIDVGEKIMGCVHLIDLQEYRPGYHLDLIMDDAQDQAIAYLAPQPAIQ